jgi:DNA mismatch repair protein MutS
MTFHSILSAITEDGAETETLEAPACFRDLNLDQIVQAITAGKQEYNLTPFFYTPLRDVDTIKYRQEVLRDLEGKVLVENIRSFAEQMRAMREHLAQADKLYCKHQKESWLLDAVEIYCYAVTTLLRDLSLLELESRGFLAFRDYLRAYVHSDSFASLVSETKILKADLSTVRYCVLIKGDTLTVGKDRFETDYSAEVLETFEKFKQGAVKDYSVQFRGSPEMNHIEAKVLEFVAQLHPDVFSHLERYCAGHGDYLDRTIGGFDRQVQFYLSYLEHCTVFKDAGLNFCYPQIADNGNEVYDYEGFDLALAHKLMRENASVVCNDFYLKGKERILVVSGPNQGGKTTFVRMFGQLHYLASLGCSVPGREARLFLFDKLFTHFEREEDIKTLRGKLEDDLVRVHEILSQASSDSIIIMNEIFTSTTLQDAIQLSTKVTAKIIKLNLLCVWVTFVDELAVFSDQTVSMVSTVAPENPALRTYKIIRRPADGLAYATAIAEKYRLTYDCLKERMKL